MKTVITTALLKKYRAKQNRSVMQMLAFAGIFCLVCLLIVPNKLVALGITASVMLFAGGLYLRYRSLAGKRDLSRVYLRCLSLLEKKEFEHRDQDEDGTSVNVEYDLDFGENRIVQADRKTYIAAREGELYYVAFYAEDDSPFACFSAADYEPGPEHPVIG